MTLQQEAYEMMKGMSDDNIRFLIEVIRRIAPTTMTENTVSASEKKTQKMLAFEEMERMRKRNAFSPDFDYEAELREAIGEKYGYFA